MEVTDGFTPIEFDLYHAFRVSSINFPFLKTLNLHTIVVIDSGAPSRSLTEFAETHNVKLVHLVTEAWRSVTSEHQQIMHVYSQALKYVLDMRNYPLLVLGTSLITGVIRRLENWSFAPIMSDYSALSEVTGAFIRLADLASIEVMEFVPGNVDSENNDSTEPEESINPLRSVVVVDLPVKEFRPEWVKNYGIDFPKA